MTTHHVCKDGQIKPYPCLLCSMCRPGEGFDIETASLRLIKVEGGNVVETEEKKFLPYYTRWVGLQNFVAFLRMEDKINQLEFDKAKELLDGLKDIVLESEGFCVEKE